jgi:hypothetical protein
MLESLVISEYIEDLIKLVFSVSSFTNIIFDYRKCIKQYSDYYLEVRFNRDKHYFERKNSKISDIVTNFQNIQRERLMGFTCNRKKRERGRSPIMLNKPSLCLPIAEKANKISKLKTNVSEKANNNSYTEKLGSAIKELSKIDRSDATKSPQIDKSSSQKIGFRNRLGSGLKENKRNAASFFEGLKSPDSKRKDTNTIKKLIDISKIHSKDSSNILNLLATQSEHSFREDRSRSISKLSPSNTINSKGRNMTTLLENKKKNVLISTNGQLLVVDGTEFKLDYNFDKNEKMQECMKIDIQLSRMRDILENARKAKLLN